MFNVIKNKMNTDVVFIADFRVLSSLMTIAHYLEHTSEQG